MNVLLWYQAFLEEGLISNVGKTNRGLTVVPIRRKHEVKTLVSSSSQTVCSLLFESLKVSNVGQLEDLRCWCMSLPSVIRCQLLDQLYHHQSPQYYHQKMTRSEYFHIMSASWQVLYTPDWTRMIIPDLQALVQSRYLDVDS